MEILKKFENKQVLFTFLGIGLLVHFRVMFNGFVGDDSQQLYNYGLVKSIQDLPKVFMYHHVVLGSENSLLGAYYKPLMLLYFYTIRAFFGLHPFFYHAPQVILAIINAFLVYLLFIKLLKKEISFFLALIFLIHPINQETVAYVSDIQDILYLFFGMTALLVMKEYKTRWQSIVIGLLLLCSLLSKESGVLFFLVTVLYTLLFYKNSFKKYPLSAKLPLTLSLVYYEMKDYKKALVWGNKSYKLDPNLATQRVINVIQEKQNSN